MFGVAAGHLLAHLLPGSSPECRQVGGDLDGTAGGGEDLDGEGDLPPAMVGWIVVPYRSWARAEMRGWSPL